MKTKKEKVSSTLSSSSFFSAPSISPHSIITKDRGCSTHRETSTSYCIASKSTLKKPLRPQALLIRGYIHYLRCAYLTGEKPAIGIIENFSNHLQALFELKDVKKRLDKWWLLFKQLSGLPSNIGFTQLYQQNLTAKENSDIFLPKIIKAIREEELSKSSSQTTDSVELYNSLPVFLNPAQFNDQPQLRTFALHLRGYSSFIEEAFSLQQKPPKEIVDDFTDCLAQLFSTKDLKKLPDITRISFIELSNLPKENDLFTLYDTTRSVNVNSSTISNLLIETMHNNIKNSLQQPFDVVL